MAVNPMIALAGQPPQIETPVEAAGKVLQLGSLMNQQKLQQQALTENDLKIQEQQRQQADQAKVADAWQSSGGNLDSFLTHAQVRGVSPQTFFELQQGIDKSAAAAAERGLSTLKLDEAKNTRLLDALDGFEAMAKADPTGGAALWPAWLQSQVQAGLVTPEHAQPFAQWQGPQTLTGAKAVLAAQSGVYQRAKTLAEANAAKVAADTKQTELENAGTLPILPLQRELLRIREIAARKAGASEPTGNAKVDQENAKEVVRGLKDGTASPEILLSSRSTSIGTAIQAEAHRQGLDTNKMTREWTATKSAIKALDSTAQLRLAQVINKASASLDRLDALNQEWSQNATRWGIKILNRASLRLAQNGAYGPDAASVATRLESQIADVTSELGQSIMGGNSPTDHALELAAKNLSGEWTQKVLGDGIQQVRYNLNLAQNARNEILQGLGVTSTQVQTPPAGSTTGPKVGDVVTVGGVRRKITALHPDGTFDGDIVK